MTRVVVGGGGGSLTTGASRAQDGERHDSHARAGRGEPGYRGDPGADRPPGGPGVRRPPPAARPDPGRDRQRQGAGGPRAPPGRAPLGGPFVDVNCAAIPETLLEAEMFGFERGAFTDARQAKKGLFQTAHRGTLFLDEIGLLPDGLQAKLLTVLEERTVRRLGATQSEPVDVWIITATNLDLQAATRAGRFREDLYHRLAVLTLALPPLRERQRDVVLLAEHFLARACADYGLPAKTLAPDARRARSSAYRWPGNVRELINTMERVALLAEASVVTADVLGSPTRSRPIAATGPAPEGSAAAPTLAAVVDGAERAHVQEALEATGWNVTRAAARLGISRNTIRYRMEKHGLRPGAPAPPRRPRQPPPALAAPGPRPRRPRLASRPPAPGIRWERRRLAVLLATLASGRDVGPPRHRARDRGARRQGPVVRRPRRGARGQRVRRALRTRADRGPGAPGRAGGGRHAARGRAHVGRRRRARASGSASTWGPSSSGAFRTLRWSTPRTSERCWARWARCWRAPSPARSSSAPRGRPSSPGASTCSRSAPRPAAGRRSGSTGSSEGRPRAVVARASSAGTTSSISCGAGWRRRCGARVRWWPSPARRASASRGSSSSSAGACSDGALPRRALPALRDADPVPAARRAAPGGVRDRRDRRAGGRPREASGDARPRRHGRARGDAVPARSSSIPGEGGEALGRLSPEVVKARTFEALRELSRRLAGLGPLVLVVEDLHWVDRTSEEYLGTLVDVVAGARILLVTTHRPGYRPPWMDRSYATQVALQPLSAQESLSLVRDVIGAAEVDEPDGRDDRGQGRGQPVLHRGAGPGGGRGRQPRAGIGGPGHRRGRAHGPHRPAGRRGQARPPGRGGHRAEPALPPAPGDPGAGRRGAPRAARPAPGRGVPLRDARGLGARIHVQARADPRGGVREPPARAAAGPPRPHRRRPGELAAGGPGGARRAAGAPRDPGRGVGEGRRLRAARGAPGDDPVGAPGCRGLVRPGRGGAGPPPRAARAPRAGDRPPVRPAERACGLWPSSGGSSTVSSAPSSSRRRWATRGGWR